MVFAITSTSGLPAARRRSTSGMSLMELVVAMAISVLVMAAVAALFSYSARSFAAVANYVELDVDSRQTLEKMSQEIRQADRILKFSTNQLIMTNITAGKLVSYTYDPSLQKLFRTNGTESEVLLTKCESFAFSYFTNDTLTNSFEQVVATGTNDVKMVQCNWRCFRMVIGQRNTESIQSAKILVRKQ